MTLITLMPMAVDKITEMFVEKRLRAHLTQVLSEHASSKIKYSPHVMKSVGEPVFFLVRPHKPAKDVNLTSLASLQALILE